MLLMITYQHTWCVTLFLALVISGTILAMEFPIGFYSPDVSYHTAKILRASKGEFFIDPFVGIPTIYPSLFHFCFGLLKRFLGFDSFQIVRLIILFNFIGLFVAFFYCARAFFNSAEETSLCVLSLPLIFYAPTGHYVLLAQPSNFSVVFLVFGIGALYRYFMSPRLIYLILGGSLLSLAVNIWWINIFVVFPMLLLLTYYIIRRGPIPEMAHIFVFILALLLPCIYTAWQFYNIWDILPHYFTGTSLYFAGTSEKTKFLRSITEVIADFLNKGNLPFFESFYFWDFSKGTLANTSVPDIVKLFYSLLSIFHYFFLVLPFNLLLVAYVCSMLLRKDKLILRNAHLLRTLPIGGFFILLCSIGTVADKGKLWRVHFIIYIVFLLFACKTLSIVIGSENLRKLSIGICVASVFSLIYTVTFSPRLFTSSIPETDNEIVQFITSIPNHDNERVFILDNSLHRIAPFVAFQSFVESRNGLYYHADPIATLKIYGDFLLIKEKRKGWCDVLRERNIKWFIFRISELTESIVFGQYQNDGSILLRNRDWVVLKMNVCSLKNDGSS